MPYTIEERQAGHLTDCGKREEQHERGGDRRGHEQTAGAAAPHPAGEIRRQLTAFRHHVREIGVAEHRGVDAGRRREQCGDADHYEADAPEDRAGRPPKARGPASASIAGRLNVITTTELTTM